MKPRVLPEAEAELNAAARWYEERREGLGVDFLEAAIDAFTAIERHPKRFSRARVRSKREYRQFRLSRFPYHIIYELRPKQIWIVAVAHAHRRPRYWTNRGSASE